MRFVEYANWMSKEALRISLSRKRKKLTPEQVTKKSLAIANRVKNLPIWDKSFYHVFLSIAVKNEVGTDFLLHLLQGRDKNVVISKSDFSTKEMSHFLLTDATVIKENSYGIPEPQSGIPITIDQLDVVFVPLLGFDATGNRLGYGGGFYDRFLAACRPDCLKIGLSLLDQMEARIPAEETDVKLDTVVTPDKVIQF